MTDRILINAFDMNCPTHLVAGTWRHPESQGRRYKDLRYWTDLARTLEAGLFDGLFIADVLGVYDVFGASNDAALRGGIQVPVNDPMMLVSAMAHVTEHLGFGITASTGFEHPYPFARRLSTLDHLTEGRIGWNIVTSYLNSGALNLGLAAQVAHDERYDHADEYLEVLYKLFEGSWEDDAVVADPDSGVYADPARVHPIAHEGRWFKVPGIHLAEPSPQRTPLLYQAGASARGRRFAGTHAEAVFLSAPTRQILRDRVTAVRAEVVAAGRDAGDVKVFSAFSAIVAETDREARAKADVLRSYLETEGSLTLLSGWTGHDLSGHDLDAPLRLAPNDAIRSAAEALGDGDLTLRDMVDRFGAGVNGPGAVGSPQTVADEIQEWLDDTGADGLNLAHVITPGSYADFARLVVPELQRRGVYRTRYDEGTLREKLFGAGPRLNDRHPGTRYRRAALAAR